MSKKYPLKVNALISLLMLVVDLDDELVDTNDGRELNKVRNQWRRAIALWSYGDREAAHRWAGDRALIASDHIVKKPAPRPACIDELPYQKRYDEQFIVFKTENTVWTKAGIERVLVDALMKCRYRTSLACALDMLARNGCVAPTDLLGLFTIALDGKPNVVGDGNRLIDYARQRIDLHTTQPTNAVPSEASTLTEAQKLIADECGRICAMLIAKNKAYGNSALEPVRIFSKASADEQINVRIDDKLSRIMRGHAAGEDVEDDLAGYLILKKVQKRLSDRSERKG